MMASSITLIGAPVSVSISGTKLATETTSLSSQIASVILTSTHSSTSTQSSVTSSTFTTADTPGILISSAQASTSAGQTLSTTSAETISSPVSSAAAAAQTPSSTPNSLTPQLRVGVGVAAGLLGMALIGSLIFVFMRLLARRRMRRTPETVEKGQSKNLGPFESIGPPVYEIATPYPSDFGHETMSYSATGLELKQTMPTQAQELWTPGLVPATVYERYKTSGRYELDTEGAVR